ncbi:MAG: hypothetical protein KKB70_04810 [Proteobacteria bacterium]|nr:hypothetical protein [Pseudomonadota bacterium]MBU1611065.1 hypothetical protein [Pseudomonadota bacterium]
MTRIATIILLLLLVAAATASATPTQEYMRVMALINWTEVIPEARFTEENMPKSFNARVRKASKLVSLGLAAHIGDMVHIEQQGPYIWKISNDNGSINVNTYDIPAAAYPKFQ